jgi:hypothetical protein
LLTVRKCAHLDGLAIPDGVNVCKLYVLPPAAALETNMGMNENYDTSADWKKFFWFTGSFGQPRSGLREITLHPGVSVVSASSGKALRFTPHDVGIKWLQGCIDIASINAA